MAFQFPAKSRLVLTDLVVCSGHLLSLRFNCRILVPKPSEVTTTGIVALPTASDHVLETYYSCFAKSALLGASRRTKHVLGVVGNTRSGCVQNEVYSTYEFLFPRACLARSGLCGLVGRDSWRSVRPHGLTQVFFCPTVMEYSVRSPLTRMYHTSVTLSTVTNALFALTFLLSLASL